MIEPIRPPIQHPVLTGAITRSRSIGPTHFEVTRIGNDQLIHSGPGVLHCVLIGNAGCCTFELRDDSRPLFRMSPAFAGSFFLEVGFSKNLTLDVNGEMLAHIDISYRPATNV